MRFVVPMVAIYRTMIMLLSCLPYGIEGAVGATQQELYTQNAVCRSQFCTNPIFPGLNDLPRLEQIKWQCPSTEYSITSYLDFCHGAVVYAPALPSPNKTSTELAKLVQSQDHAASTMFFYHLSGMGYEPWDHQKPQESDDPCVKAAWKMVCYTYFPKAATGCQAGFETQYMRPCKSCCTDYLQACKVECCDESASCTFEHQVSLDSGDSFVQTGYVDALAPHASCTGMSSSAASRRSAPLLALLVGLFFTLQQAVSQESSSSSSSQAASSSATSTRRRNRGLVWKSAIAGVLAVFACFLQGCAQIPHHQVGNWRQKDDYLIRYKYGEESKADLNSCSRKDISETKQCSGRGYCKAWDDSMPSQISFCFCERDWTDPECRTRRLSQTKVFLLSLFGGVFGLDYLYLGLPLVATAKFFSLGGFGVWWLADIIRMGSGPVYAHDYRVAADLPRWVYVLTTTFIFLAAGFIGGMLNFFRVRRKKRQDVMLMLQSEEEQLVDDEVDGFGPQWKDVNNDFKAKRAFAGYGATLPMPIPNAGAPYFAKPGAVPAFHGASGQVGSHR